MSKGLSYRDAGVDIEAGDALVEAIKPFARRTLRPEVLAGIGGFGALCQIPQKYRHPVLVSGTDGVGTKLKLAFERQRHDTVGIDLVAMSVNDILACGAEPLFFLDYYVCEKLDVRVATQVVKGIAAGCELAGCALIGNVPRVLPEKTRAVIKKASWPRPEVFRWLQREGNVAEEEMQRVFNCGIGMVLVAAAADAKRAADSLRAAGETVYEIGVIEKTSGAPQAIIV